MDSSISLKASLLVEGISADEECLTGLGKLYKEQNHGPFGWDSEDHAGHSLPDVFRLPDGAVVEFRLNRSSVYRIRRIGEKNVLFCLEEPLCQVQWIARPAYYDAATRNNVGMAHIGRTLGEDCLFICYRNYCSHFCGHRQCLYCNLVSTSAAYQSLLEKKDIEEIGEVAGAAWGEGAVNHVLLTGGCFIDEQEVELVTKIVDSIRVHAGFDRVPGIFFPSPAKNGSIERYFDAGIGAVGFRMETWNQWVCDAVSPGKSDVTSHKEIVKSVEKAVKVFGPGNVYGVFIMGLEHRETFIANVRALTDVGANVLPYIGSSNPESPLFGHRAPGTGWYVDVTEEVAEVVRRSGVPAGTENHCHRCDGNSLLNDALGARVVA